MTTIHLCLLLFLATTTDSSSGEFEVKFTRLELAGLTTNTKYKHWAHYVDATCCTMIGRNINLSLLGKGDNVLHNCIFVIKFCAKFSHMFEGNLKIFNFGLKAVIERQFYKDYANSRSHIRKLTFIQGKCWSIKTA